MHKLFAVAIGFILLLSSGAFADIGSEQQFTIQASNVGTVTGPGVGAVASTNIIPVFNSQQAVESSGTIITVQTVAGSLFQGASATGLSDIYGYQQGAFVGGNQWQALSGLFGIGQQGQDLGTQFSQDVIGMGGWGAAAAAQSFAGNQNQLILTPNGVNANIQCVGVNLTDGLGGQISSVFSRSINIKRTVIQQ